MGFAGLSNIVSVVRHEQIRLLKIEPIFIFYQFLIIYNLLSGSLKALNMSKKHPTTPAIRFLRQNGVAFLPFEYDYVEHGGTSHSAQELGVDEHCVIKTIVLQDENKQAMIVLMHGDCEISTRNMARTIGVKHIETVKPETVTKLTGYMVGGCSPFGTKQALPVYVEKTILDLPEIYINGGKRGFLVKIKAEDLHILKPIAVEVAV